MRNGVETLLDTSYSYAGHIIAKDTDIYIAGYTFYTATHPYTPVYWKNGQKVQLAGSSDGQAVALNISGNDLYIAGSADDKAVYWKNGVLTQLAVPDTAGPSSASGIAIIGNDVYVSGQMGMLRTHATRPVFWKNGVLTFLASAGVNGSATGVTVHGNDVYIPFYGSTTYTQSTAYYWKNGVTVQLANIVEHPYRNFPSDVTINGNDVYFAGSVSVGEPDPKYLLTEMVSVYWKNNVINFLDIPLYKYAYKYHGATQVMFFQNDFYATGFAQFGMYNTPANAYYWKNGQAVKLSDYYSVGRGIVGVEY